MTTNTSNTRVIAIRFGTSQQFLADYAELLRNEVFAEGEVSLNMGETVLLDVEFSGFSILRVTARVKHTVAKSETLLSGAPAGSLLSVQGESSEFRDTLHQYHQLLISRGNSAAVVKDVLSGDALAAHGYRIVTAPAPDRILVTLARIEENVVGIVVPKADVAQYKAVLLPAGLAQLVVSMDRLDQVDETLTSLDAQL